MVDKFNNIIKAGMRYGNADDYRLTRKQFDIINNNRKLSGLPPLSYSCLKSNEQKIVKTEHS